MNSDRSESRLAVAHLQVGARVSVNGKSGVVRFVGTTQFSSGQWVGVELALPQGKNDGSVQDVRYFTCESSSPSGLYGLFVRPNIIKPEASPKIAIPSSFSASPRLSISPSKVCICVSEFMGMS